jgi:prepilin-type N-terminal cleavage/methylation domain-containing protein
MNYRSAFTLVELAIVIVIIGLLVGGVLQGQELIKQAKWRSAMKEIEGYRGAMATFFGKYNCVPGDCPHGFRFFGTNCGSNSTVTNTADNMGCNGSGDKTLTNAEGQLLWRHLSLGNMIKGSFTQGYANVVATNVHIPPISISDNVGVSAFFSQGNPDSSTACGFEYCEGHGSIRGGIIGRNVFGIGNTTQSTGGIARGAFMTPMEAYEFDVKFDDGVYNTGSISGHPGGLSETVFGSCGDYTSNVYYNTHASYRNARGCRMIFDSGF